MSKTLVQVPCQTTVDWSAPSDQDKALVKSELWQMLHDLGCECNGKSLAVDSAATTIQQRIKAIAITRRVDLGIKELATSRGIDVATADPAVITAASSADEINSLIALESIISQDTIDKMLTNEEMGDIQQEELAKSRLVRDPEWAKDLGQLVRRAEPHPFSFIDQSGLAVVTTVQIKLDTIQVEIDDRGEVCAWIYEIPTI